MHPNTRATIQGLSVRHSVDSSLTSPSGAGSLYGSVVDISGRGRSGVGEHLTPSKRFKRSNSGELLTHRMQGKCRGCHPKCTNVCSMCLDERPHDKPMSQGPIETAFHSMYCISIVVNNRHFAMVSSSIFVTRSSGFCTSPKTTPLAFGLAGHSSTDDAKDHQTNCKRSLSCHQILEQQQSASVEAYSRDRVHC
jgi:hypothetical protein